MFFLFFLFYSFALIVDIICIGTITSYLDRNVHPIFQIYSSSTNAWCNSWDFYKNLTH